jgi:hypothetical protein
MKKDFVISLEVDDSGAVQNIEKVEKSLSASAESASSVKAELRQIQKELEKLPQGSKEFNELAKRAGELKDQINDASEAVRANAGNAFETLNNNVGNLGQRFASLDFDGITQDFKGIATSVGNIKADDLSKGLKNVGATFVSLGKALLANPIFLVAAAIIGIGAALVALKDKIKPIAALFNGIGEVIDAVSAKIEAFLQVLGLTASEAEKANQKVIDSAQEVIAEIDKRYSREIKLAQAAGKETIFLEIEKRKAQLKTIDEVVKALIAKGTIEGTLNEEELKKLQELKQQKLDIETDLQATILAETEKNNDKRIADNERASEASKKRAEERKAAAKKQAEEEARIAEEALKEAQRIAAEQAKIAEEQERARLDALVKANEERIKIQEQQFQIEQELVLNQQEKEIAAVVEKYDTLFEIANGNIELEKQLTEKRNQEIAAINKAAVDTEIENQRRLNEQRIQLASDVIGALAVINDSVEAKSTAQAKRQFNVNKALGIAQAAISTYQAVNAQLAVPQDALTGANFVKAGIALAVGLANVAKIARTKFEGGAPSGGGGSISAGGGAGGSPNVSAGPPQFNPINTQFLQNRPPQAAPTYVISGAVTNAQQADQKINELARL